MRIMPCIVETPKTEKIRTIPLSKIRSAASKAVIYACLSEGIRNKSDINRVLHTLSMTKVSDASIAGCKAAITKGQKVF